MDLQILKTSIKGAGLYEDLEQLNDILYGSDHKCGIACAPGCFLMSPAAT